VYLKYTFIHLISSLQNITFNYFLLRLLIGF